MNAESIIRQADQAGIELFLAGDRIAARPKSKLSADLRELIKTHREEVIRTLREFSLPSFCRLVQHYGTDHGLLLEESEILNELDTDGIADLQPAQQSGDHGLNLSPPDWYRHGGLFRKIGTRLLIVPTADRSGQSMI